jgi:hypothetical protein
MRTAGALHPSFPTSVSAQMLERTPPSSHKHSGPVCRCWSAGIVVREPPGQTQLKSPLRPLRLPRSWWKTADQMVAKIIIICKHMHAEAQ